MGKVIRIEDDSIRSMRKTLDDLPDKRLGKTRDEVTELLFEHLKKAMEKGYSFKELADILEKGNVSIDQKGWLNPAKVELSMRGMMFEAKKIFCSSFYGKSIFLKASN